MNMKRYVWFFIPILLYSSNYAICKAQRFDSALAKVKIEKILNKDPQNIQCLLQLANIYLKKGKISKGFDILTEAYSIDSNIVKNSKIAKILPFALHVTELKHMANLTNKYFYWSKLADGYFNLGIMSEAIVYYKKSLRIDSNQLNVRLRLSIAYGNIGQIYNSIDQVKEALKNNPKSFYANFYMARILKNEFKDSKDSKVYFKKAYNVLVNRKAKFKQKEYNRLINKLLMER